MKKFKIFSLKKDMESLKKNVFVNNLNTVSQIFMDDEF